MINRGRAAITLRDIEVEPLETDRRTAVSWSDWAGGPGAPPTNFRLEPGADQVWRIENPERLRTMLTRDPQERPLCRFVAILATGKPVVSNEVRVHFEEIAGLDLQIVSADELHGDDHQDG